MSKTSLHTRRIAISAIFLSIALVLRLVLTFYLPIYGHNGVRVNPGTIFAILPAILFGPVYGAIVAGLFDLLGFLLRPTGTFLPWMTIVVATGGLLRGFLWRGLRTRNPKALRVCILIFAILLFLSSAFNLIVLHIGGINARLIGAAGFALLLLAVDRILSKWLVKEERQSPVLPLTITILLAGLFVSTLNTVVLHRIFWSAIPFTAVWVPRVAISLLVDVVFVYFVALLLGLFERQEGLKNLVE